MLQITALNSAKPAPSGMEVLAGVPGEGQDSSSFEGVLTTQMESAAPANAKAGNDLKHASGKMAGKAGGKILPVGLPDSLELPSGKGEATPLDVPVLSVEDGEQKEETAIATLPQVQVPLIVAPVLPEVQSAMEMATAAPGEGRSHAAARAPLPQAVAKVASQLPADTTAAVPAAPGQQTPAAQPGLPPVLTTPQGNVPVYLAQSSGKAGQLPLPVQIQPAQALRVTALPVTALPVTALPVTATPVTATPVTMAPVTTPPVTTLPVMTLPVTPPPVKTLTMSPPALSGEAIRLRPTMAKGSQAGAETAVVPTSAVPAPAENAVALVPELAAEAESTVATVSRQAVRIAGLSAKEGIDMAQQLPGFAEGRQDASGWFGASAHSQTVAATPVGQFASAPMGERPHDFAALVDQLVAAREFAMPAPVYAAIAHSEFGQVSLKFEHGDQGLSVAVSSPDPDFARAVQAAAPSDRNGTTQDYRDGGNTGNSTAYRQDMLSQSDSGAQAQSRNAGGSDRHIGGDRRLRSEDTAANQAEKGKPRQDGIFA